MKKTFLFIGLLAGLLSCSKNNSPSAPVTIPAATIITNIAKDIDADSARISGEIKLNGDTSIIIETGICVGTAPQPDITKARFTGDLRDGAFFSWVRNLQSGTTYFARAYYKTASRVAYGNDVSFVAARYPTELKGANFQGPVLALCTGAGGDVYAGGEFYHSGNSGNYQYVARFSGSAWAEVTGLKSNSAIRALCTDQSGNVFAAESKYNPTYENDMAKWNGSTWSTVGVYTNNNYPINASCTDAAGNVYALGLAPNAAGKYCIISWGPSGNRQLGNFDEFPLTICTDKKGNLYVAGLMNHGNNFNNYYIAKWDGASWTEIGNFNNIINCMCVDAAGNLLVGGAFTNANKQYYYIATWNGNTWGELGKMNLPYDYYSEGIQKICTGIDGTVYATGNFVNAKGRYYIAKWDGNSWTDLASFNKSILAICADKLGNVYASSYATNAQGQWYVAKCN